MKESKMDLIKYQLQAHSFADYTQPIILDDENKTALTVEYIYPVMGLAEEAGELVGKFAKAIRDCKGEVDDERKREIIKELGDCLWFVSEIATLLNVSLEEVMQKNIDKLTSRRERGVIYGSGDNR